MAVRNSTVVDSRASCREEVRDYRVNRMPSLEVETYRGIRLHDTTGSLTLTRERLIFQPDNDATDDESVAETTDERRLNSGTETWLWRAIDKCQLADFPSKDSSSSTWSQPKRVLQLLVSKSNESKGVSLHVPESSTERLLGEIQARLLVEGESRKKKKLRPHLQKGKAHLQKGKAKIYGGRKNRKKKEPQAHKISPGMALVADPETSSLSGVKPSAHKGQEGPPPGEVLVRGETEKKEGAKQSARKGRDEAPLEFLPGEIGKKEVAKLPARKGRDGAPMEFLPRRASETTAPKIPQSSHSRSIHSRPSRQEEEKQQQRHHSIYASEQQKQQQKQQRRHSISTPELSKREGLSAGAVKNGGRRNSFSELDKRKNSLHASQLEKGILKNPFPPKRVSLWRKMVPPPPSHLQRSRHRRSSLPTGPTKQRPFLFFLRPRGPRHHSIGKDTDDTHSDTQDRQEDQQVRFSQPSA